MMNNNMNMQTKDKTHQLSNNRAPVPVIPRHTTSMDTMGRLQGKQEFAPNNRTNYDVKNILKGNPYALSIV